MSSVRKEFRKIDCLFKHEDEIKSEQLLKIISTTYEVAKSKNTEVYETAKSRYREREYFLTTCIKKFIGKSTYYRLLEIFWKIALKELEKSGIEKEKLW